MKKNEWTLSGYHGSPQLLPFQLASIVKENTFGSKVSIQSNQILKAKQY